MRHLKMLHAKERLKILSAGTKTQHSQKFFLKFLKNQVGTSLGVHWLRLHAFIAGSSDSIPDWGTKIPYAMWHDQKT